LKRHLTILLFLSTFLALGFMAGMQWREPGGRSLSAQEPDPRPIATQRAFDADEAATIDLFQGASPSVAFITSVSYRRSPFTLDVQRIQSGSGSGFVWDDRGHIVTNFHVIEGASAAQVTLADKSSWDARIVGVAPEKDLAVLAIDAPAGSLSPMRIGRSADLLVGQKVYAIGNPFGLDQTLTTGIISALGREIESPARVVIRDLIQTDAAINPGNSGGPLLDSSGRLIGVNTAIYSPSGASAGISFAIPVDTVNWVVPEILVKGRIERPTLGLEQVSAQRYLDVEGSLVTRVEPGSGADRAGLRGTSRDRRGRLIIGDIIISIDEQPVRGADDLILALERRREGELVRVRFLRDGEEHSVEVSLGPPSR
jgi:S1-C subfamily serine protease